MPYFLYSNPADIWVVFTFVTYDNIAVKICVKVFVWAYVLISLVWIHGNGINGLNETMFNFCRIPNCFFNAVESFYIPMPCGKWIRLDLNRS